VQNTGSYANAIKQAEKDIKEKAKKINDLCGKLRLLTEIFATHNTYEKAMEQELRIEDE
jgi:hypothetical protein